MCGVQLRGWCGFAAIDPDAGPQCRRGSTARGVEAAPSCAVRNIEAAPSSRSKPPPPRGRSRPLLARLHRERRPGLQTHVWAKDVRLCVAVRQTQQAGTGAVREGGGKTKAGRHGLARAGSRGASAGKALLRSGRSTHGRARQRGAQRVSAGGPIPGDQPVQPDSQDKSDQPCSEEQSYQPHNWGQSHPRSLLENFFTFRDWIPAVQTPSAGGRAQAYEGSLCTSHETQRT